MPNSSFVDTGLVIDTTRAYVLRLFDPGDDDPIAAHHPVVIDAALLPEVSVGASGTTGDTFYIIISIPQAAAGTNVPPREHTDRSFYDYPYALGWDDITIAATQTEPQRVERHLLITGFGSQRQDAGVAIAPLNLVDTSGGGAGGGSGPGGSIGGGNGGSSRSITRYLHLYANSVNEPAAPQNVSYNATQGRWTWDAGTAVWGAAPLAIPQNAPNGTERWASVTRSTVSSDGSVTNGTPSVAQDTNNGLGVQYSLSGTGAWTANLDAEHRNYARWWNTAENEWGPPIPLVPGRRVPLLTRINPPTSGSGGFWRGHCNFNPLDYDYLEIVGRKSQYSASGDTEFVWSARIPIDQVVILPTADASRSNGDLLDRARFAAYVIKSEGGAHITSLFPNKPAPSFNRDVFDQRYYFSLFGESGRCTALRVHSWGTRHYGSNMDLYGVQL